MDRITVPASTRYGRRMLALHGDAWRQARNASRRRRRALVPPDVRRAKRAAYELRSKLRRSGVAA